MKERQWTQSSKFSSKQRYLYSRRRSKKGHTNTS